MKKALIKLAEELETEAQKCAKLYRAYPEGKYDADYYLYLGRTSALGEAVDKIEALIIADPEVCPHPLKHLSPNSDYTVNCLFCGEENLDLQQ